jgi:hypothetical protein
MYMIMWILAGVSFFGKYAFYNIGLTSRLYRYAWGYFIFHAASLMIMVTVAYMLYMPWGKYNIIDYLAQRFHEVVNGKANVPYLGYSWLLMMLDVQFQLFVTFTFYAVFIIFVTQSFARALDDWKAISESDEKATPLPINIHHFKDFLRIMQERIDDSPELQTSFQAVRVRFPESGVISERQSGFVDFKLHLYLTVQFGKAIEYLVEASMKAHLFIFGVALFICFLAHHYQVAFMYFLPVFIVLGVLMFACSYFLSKTLRSNTHEHDLDFLTIHAYCRAVQLILYAVFYSFTRLLLSSDIFLDYPKVYMSAFIGLLLTLLLGYLFSGELMKATICSICLPHVTQKERFELQLQQVGYWYTTERCHECGVIQAPSNASRNREWAGAPRSQGSISPAQSSRMMSFRAV